MAATVTPSSCSIVVQQLALGCQEPELKSLFSPFGRIVSIEVYSEGHDVQEDSIFAGTKRRSAEIVFAVANTAWVAYEQLNGTLFMNEPLR